MAYRTVQVRCPACQQVGDVPAHQMRQYRCVTRPDRSFYAWTCPACAAAVTRPLDVNAATLLTYGGVPTVRYEYPQEMTEPKRSAGGWRPYETDDLLLDIASLPTYTGTRERKDAA